MLQKATCAVAYEMNFVDGWECYRVSRHPWHGIALAPTLIIEAHSSHITLLFNKFGDKNIDHFNIYGGTSPHPTTILATSDQTLKELNNLDNNRTYYFRVTAVSNTGQESDYSNEENIFVNITQPGANLVLNGDFSDNKNNWTWELQAGAQAEWNIDNGTSYFNITNGGSAIYGVQIRQNGKELIKGEEYVFEFDAWADASRVIEAKVGQDAGDYINYSKIGFSSILTSKKHFSYTFTMEDPTDYNARVVFNSGDSDINLYIDNVTLKLVDPTGIADLNSNIPKKYTLADNYPNPFNATTRINYKLAEDSKVNISIFNISGQYITTLVNGFKGEGNYSVTWNAAKYSSGIYFYKMVAGSFIETKKMLLLK